MTDCTCDTDPISCLEQLFVEQVQRGRIRNGQNPARRPVFLRLHGVAHGRLEICPELAPELQVGLFAQPRDYPAWVRFSSDIPDSVAERKSTCGVGIKLFGVDGDKLLAPDTKAPTMDLLFQNHDVFFVDDARDMCSFTRASLAGAEAFAAWEREHPETAPILEAMQKDVSSVLGIRYWSVIPFRFGPAACKFVLEPELPIDGPAGDAPDALARDLEDRLRQGEVRLRLLVQVSDTLPVDRATVRWTEAEAPPRHVATLVLPRQDVSSRQQAAYGENLAFNPWRTLAAHEPLGTIAEARKVVYQASANLRRDVNGTPRGEPVEPRPPAAYPAAEQPIVRCAIHPAIGVARVGNSEDGWYYGPEVPDPPPTTLDHHRDATGALKRQAARFRVYGYDAEGRVVRELTAADAEITWSVHVANKKAAWYRYDRALDIPEAKGTSVPLRNIDLRDRSLLVIDPGPRSIAGRSSDPVPFDTGRFLGAPVYLGELRTDDRGRLVVLGGHGVSASPTDQKLYDPDDAGTFNNADGWHDDTSDGPVCATVVVAGRTIPCEPAWVVVAPPNFAPDLVGWRTMYDLRVDTARVAGALPIPARPSFQQDILPILRRLGELQWVNAGFAAFFGHGGPMRFDDPALLRKLAAAPRDYDPYGELRRTVANSFRGALAGTVDPGTWPWIYGDGFGTGPNQLPTANLPLPATWARFLDQWADGDFEADWDPGHAPPSTLDAVPVAEQPATLDRAALQFCVADAFHPGCELTWPMRHQTMFTSTFRIRHADPNIPEPNLGRTLTPELAMSLDGPLYGQRPGDLTRWMALPWQMDTAYCRSGYDHEYDPYLPTFWPARVPNQVLTEEDWQVITRSEASHEEKVARFHHRESWFRQLPDAKEVEQASKWMVANFHRQGVVLRRDGVPDDPELPPAMWVEALPEAARDAAEAGKQAHRERVSSSGAARWAVAGWSSADQREALLRLWNRG